jgi:hypothetical protein
VYELESLLTQSADAFVEGLDKQLQTLLDEAEEVLAAMPGVIDAETAITEGKVAEYTRWRELHQSYIALRSDHLELLRAADPAGNFASGRPAIGYAFYRSLDSALPTFIAALEDGGSTIDRLPFDVVTPSDPGHWRATVARRALLEPTVEYADEAVAAAGAAAERHRVAADSPQREPERLASLASSHPHMAQRSRNQGPVITPRVLQPFDQRRGA